MLYLSAEFSLFANVVMILKSCSSIEIFLNLVAVHTIQCLFYYYIVWLTRLLPWRVIESWDSLTTCFDCYFRIYKISQFWLLSAYPICITTFQYFLFFILAGLGHTYYAEEIQGARLFISCASDVWMFHIYFVSGNNLFWSSAIWLHF